MDNIRLGNKKTHFLKALSNDRGQSAVEYILLFSVITVLATSIFKSDGFKGIFGDEGLFAKTYKEEVEFSYRHALGGRKKYSTPNYRSNSHKSYKSGSETRFFGAKEKYGN